MLDDFDKSMYLFANSKPHDMMNVGKVMKEVIGIYQRFLDSNEAIFTYNEEREKILLESYIHESWIDGKKDEIRNNICLLLSLKYPNESLIWIDKCSSE